MASADISSLPMAVLLPVVMKMVLFTSSSQTLAACRSLYQVRTTLEFHDPTKSNEMSRPGETRACSGVLSRW
jgi:hypothetical protein